MSEIPCQLEAIWQGQENPAGMYGDTAAVVDGDGDGWGGRGRVGGMIDH